MLGINRASEYAGWWSSGPPAMRTSVAVTTNSTAAFPVTPRNYIDNPAVSYSGVQLFDIFPPGGSQPMDQSGITTGGGTETTWAFTLRFGTNYLTTAPSTGTYALTWFDSFYLAGTRLFPLMQIGLNNNVYVIGTQTTTSGQSNTTFNNFNSLRNTWLGIVVSSSATSSSFAGWTGTGTGSAYQRITITNVETGAVLQQTDTVITTGTIYNRALTNQYYFDSTSSYSYAPILYDSPGGSSDWGNYYSSDFDLASIWINWGVALDPAVYINQITGSAPAQTVGGQKAWFALTSQSGTNSATGYSFNLPTGSRTPDTTVISSNNLSLGANASQLVSF